MLSSLLVMMPMPSFGLLLEADVDVEMSKQKKETITVYTAPTDLHKAIVTLRESVSKNSKCGKMIHSIRS